MVVNQYIVHFNTHIPKKFMTVAFRKYFKRI